MRALERVLMKLTNMDKLGFLFLEIWNLMGVGKIMRGINGVDRFCTSG